MAEYVFTPTQCIQLLEAIERVRSRLVKKRPIEVNIGRYEENRFKAYTDATAGRHDMTIDQEGYRFTLRRGDSITVEVICVHDCGSCVYYVYKATFDETSLLAREVLTLVDSDPEDIDEPRVRDFRKQLFHGLAA